MSQLTLLGESLQYIFLKNSNVVSESILSYKTKQKSDQSYKDNFKDQIHKIFKLYELKDISKF